MLQSYLVRGLKVGAVGGLAFGLFVALVMNPLVGATEALAGDHGHEAGSHAHGAAGQAGVAGLFDLASTDALGILAGGFWGLLLGVAVFGFAVYFLEPAVPGADDTRSYLLGAAGFVTVSGAPWLVLPPKPPGVETALSTDAGLLWYAGAMVAGGLACGLAGYTYTRLRDAGRLRAVAAAVVPLAALLGLGLVAPPAPTTDAIPAAAATGFRALVVLGQLALWGLLAGTHAWLFRRDDTDTQTRSVDTDSYELSTAD